MRFIASFIAGGLMTATASAQTATLPDLAAHAAASAAEQARYPAWSQPLQVDSDPILSAREISIQSVRGPNGEAPALQAWTSDVAVQPGETIQLFAQLAWLDTEQSPWEQLRSATGAWSISAELVTEAGETLANLEYVDTGRGLDVLAGDGVFTTALTLDATQAPPLGQASSVLVRLTATAPDGTVRKGSTGFLYSNPAAKLTGRFRQSIEDGHLVVLAEATVAAAGRVHLEGSLADLAGQPRAIAQTAEVLSPGMHWIPLRFHGQLIRDLGLVDALRLRAITLRSTQGMPNAIGPVFTDALTLAPIPLERLAQSATR
ncbi:MAG: hypothetical protein ABF271_12960 [Abyssibacter sp.]|uniref:hypothetical protein n=1 Tax=Abyssibacter sp. TaxID=2320200 RepID=UPI00321995F8